MRSLYLHCASSRQYYFFEQELQHRNNDYIAILPVNRAVRILKQRLLNDVSSGALKDPLIYTFDQLLIKLYTQLPHALPVLPADMLQVVIESVLEKNSQSLPYFLKNPHLTSGLVHKVADALKELRRFGFDLNAFEKIRIGEKEDQPQKYQDFEQLLSGLDQELGKQFIDEPFAKHAAAQLFTKEMLQQCFPQLQIIFISGYGLFTPAMYTFIDKVSEWLPVHLKLEYHPQNKALFEHTHEAYQKFKQMGAQEQVVHENRDLALRLFNREISIQHKQDQRERIQIEAQQDRKAEIEFIARGIHRLHNDQQIPLARIALTSANLDMYLPLITSTFSDFGIPFNLSTGFALKQSPLFNWLMQPLRVILSGFEWNSVFLFLSGELFVIKDLNLRLLHKALVASRIKHLQPGWNKTLILKTFRPDDQNEIKAIVAEIEEILEPLYRFPKESTLTEFRDQFIALLNTLHFLDWYEIPNKNLGERDRENEFRAFNRFMKLSEQMVWLAAHITEDKEISLKRFMQYLESVIEKASYNLTEWPDFGVQIMPRLEIQAVEAQVFFLAGLNDGVFPRSTTKDVFFSDAVRQKIGLVATEELLAQDRFIFYSLLDSVAEKIILTYPKYDEERVLVPSTFIADLQDTVFVGEKKSSSDQDLLQNQSGLWHSFGIAIQKRQFIQAEEIANILRTVKPTSIHQIQSLIQKTGTATRRIYPLPFGPYEGVLSDDDQIQAELDQKNKGRKWSVSRLETYAFCPMQYAFQNMLKIEEWEQFEDEATALERGALIHDILYEFYKELKNRDLQAQPLAHRGLLIQSAIKRFSDMPFKGFFWEMELNTWFGDDQSAGLFDIFLEYEQQQIEESGFIPNYFEYDFGQGITFQLGPDVLKLHGRIDRVDVNVNNDALIIDYKTGTSAAKKTAKGVLQGLNFQLPLYMLALMQTRPELQATMASYYVLKDADNCERIPYLVDTSIPGMPNGKSTAFLPNFRLKNEQGMQLNLDELLQHSLEKALAHTKALRQGVLRQTRFPKDAACSSYCPYKRICQKHPAKILRMEQQERESDETVTEEINKPN